MKYVTAAYGEKYRRWAAALVRSFKEYNPGSELIVFADGKVDGVEINPFSINSYQSGELELHIKTGVVSKVASDLGDDVCWIDCDQLALCDLSSLLVPGKFNVVGYGLTGELRRIGNGMTLPQEHYVLSGFFSMTPEIAAAYRAQATGVRVPAAEGHQKLIEQELVNRLVVKFCDQVERIDVAHPDVVSNFVGTGHPSPKNESFCSLSLGEDRVWRQDGRRVGMLCFTADCLEQHLATGFSAIRDERARTELQRLYRKDN